MVLGSGAPGQAWRGSSRDVLIGAVKEKWELMGALEAASEGEGVLGDRPREGRNGM